MLRERLDESGGCRHRALALPLRVPFDHPTVLTARALSFNRDGARKEVDPADAESSNPAVLQRRVIHRLCILPLMLDEKFAEAFERRFKNRPEWNRPDLWPVITDPSRSSQRQWLSGAIAALAHNQRRNVLSRLQSSKHFLATYNELAIIALLAESNLTVEYEPTVRLDGRTFTPDVALRAGDDSIVILIEVSTRFRTAEQRSLELQWKELRTRVNRIPRPFGLVVRDARNSLPLPPDSGRARRIEKELSTWLLRPSTDIGSTFESEGFWGSPAVQVGNTGR